jgi:RNA polymerase sigma-70 factor (ECF subfamily)
LDDGIAAILRSRGKFLFATLAAVSPFKEIYDIHSAMVYNLCLHYLQNIEAAEEAAQDVFVKVHQKLESWKGDAALKTWIYRITVNHCLDEIKARSRKKRSQAFLSLFGGESIYEPADFNHPGVLLESKEEMRSLFAIINALPEKQKTALILSRLEGLSQKEIAAVLQLTEGAVESLLQRAKDGIRKKLNEETGSRKKGKTSSNKEQDHE